jgi:hypothetical protein
MVALIGMALIASRSGQCDSPRDDTVVPAPCTVPVRDAIADPIVKRSPHFPFATVWDTEAEQTIPDLTARRLERELRALEEPDLSGQKGEDQSVIRVLFLPELNNPYSVRIGLRGRRAYVVSRQCVRRGRVPGPLYRSEIGAVTREHWQFVHRLLEDRKFCQEIVPRDPWSRFSKYSLVVEAYCGGQYKAVFVTSPGTWRDLEVYLSWLSRLDPRLPAHRPLVELTAAEMAWERRVWWPPKYMAELARQHCHGQFEE